MKRKLEPSLDTDAEPPPFTAASADYASYTLDFFLCEQYPERPKIADSQYAYCTIHQDSARGQRGSVERTGVNLAFCRSTILAEVRRTASGRTATPEIPRASTDGAKVYRHFQSNGTSPVYLCVCGNS